MCKKEDDFDKVMKVLVEIGQANFLDISISFITQMLINNNLTLEKFLRYMALCYMEVEKKLKDDLSNRDLG